MIALWRNRWVRVAVGVGIGALGGFIYWQQVGCVSGSCAITSVWWRSTLYGALMGALLIDSFKPSQKKPAH